MATIIKEVEWGVANTYKEGDNYVIEINSKLKEFPKLREKILNHEFEHTKKQGFWKNRKIDALTSVTFKDLFPIYKKHPKLFFQQNFPINYSKEKDTLFIEWSRIFLIIVYAGIGVGIYFLISLFSKDSTFFWKVIKNMVIIFGVYFVLSFIGKRLKKSINEEASRLISKKPKSYKQKLEKFRDNL